MAFSGLVYIDGVQRKKVSCSWKMILPRQFCGNGMNSWTPRHAYGRIRTMEYMRRRDMGKKSTKENKTKYHLVREELGWSREYASEQMGMITPERLERIENEKVTPDPKEILVMAETYGRPSLCNYYCSQKCPIGQQYVPEIEIKELSSIVLEMLASLNSVNKRKDRLIEITADGMISSLYRKNWRGSRSR